MIRFRLKELMFEKKATIKDVSEATGIHRNSIYLMRENLNEGVKFDSLERLTTFFDCDISDIIYDENSRNVSLEEYKFKLFNLIKSGEIEKRPDCSRSEK